MNRFLKYPTEIGLAEHYDYSANDAGNQPISDCRFRDRHFKRAFHVPPWRGDLRGEDRREVELDGGTTT